MTTDLAAAFLVEAKARDPERYAELEQRYPLSSDYDDQRHKHGEPIKRRRKRLGPAGGVPREKRRRLTDDDRQAWKAWLKEWQLDYAYAKVLADDGLERIWALDEAMGYIVPSESD